MAAGSLALLVVLGHADPASQRLMSSLFSNRPVGLLRGGTFDDGAIHRALVQFNGNLSKAYLEGDPQALAAGSMADDLKRHYAEEIDFLKRDGKTLRVTVDSIRIGNVARLPSELWRVETLESVTIGSLKASQGVEEVPPVTSNYAMAYTLDQSPSGWRVVGVETVKAGWVP